MATMRLLQACPSTPAKMALLAALLTVVQSTGVFDVTKYGAKGDGKTVDSAAIRAAAAACAAAGGGTLLFPAKGGPQRPAIAAAAAAAPCPATPCPGNEKVTFCSSLSASGQCDVPMPHKPCPPCMNPYAGMVRGFVTGALNLSSHMRVEIEPGVHLLGNSKNGSDWPLLVVDEIWPGFGHARDAPDPPSDQGRLMHQVCLPAALTS